MNPIITDIALPIGLFLIMFGMGLSLKRTDFARVLKVRKPVIIGVLSMLVLLPGLGFLFAHVFNLPPAISVGLVLVATCPGGMFSNLMTDYGKGNLALSITLTAVISCIYIFTIPAWSSLALDVFTSGDSVAIGLPFLQTFLPLALFVLLPIVIGMIVRSKAENWALAHAGKVKNTAAIIVAAIMIYIAFVQESETVENVPMILAAVIGLNLASVLIAAALGFFANLERKDRLALIMEHAVRQEGTGIYIAATLIGSKEAAVPLLLNSLVGLSIALILIWLFRRKRAGGAAQTAN